jgi:hypothetical protein
MHVLPVDWVRSPLVQPNNATIMTALTPKEKCCLYLKSTADTLVALQTATLFACADLPGKAEQAIKDAGQVLEAVYSALGALDEKGQDYTEDEYRSIKSAMDVDVQKAVDGLDAVSRGVKK